MNNYQIFFTKEVEKVLMNRTDFSDEEIQFFTNTEELMFNFTERLKHINQTHLIYTLKIIPEDMFFLSQFIQSIKSGEISRYPIGWGDKFTIHEKEYKLPKDSILNFGHKSNFSVIIDELINYPMFEFNSLVHYIAFMHSLIIEEYEIAYDILKNDNNSEKILNYLTNDNKTNMNKSLLLFYLFKGNSLKINQNLKLKIDLKNILNFSIITNTHPALEEIFGENYFGEMLTIQRDAIARLNLI